MNPNEEQFDDFKVAEESPEMENVVANTIVAKELTEVEQYKEDVLYNQRAEHGKQVLKNLSVKLTERYGSGWSYYKLQHCVRSAYTFSEDEIVYATRIQLNWTHLRSLMGIKAPLERQFYAQMCCAEHWDTRTLDEKIDKQLYLQTALSRKPEEVIKKELGVEIEEPTLSYPYRNMAANNKYGHRMGLCLHPSLGGSVLIQRTLSKRWHCLKLEIKL